MCNSHNFNFIPECHTYRLAAGAPKIDSDKAVEKVAFGIHLGSGIEILTAHYTVTKLQAMDVKVEVDHMQVTVISAWSWIGVLAVLAVSVLASISMWAASFWAKRKWGYKLRLHSYSGLAAYAASLEDTRNFSGEKLDVESFAAGGGEQPPPMEAQGKWNKQRPCIRLREGDGDYDGLVSIGQNPAARGVKVKSGRIGTGFASVDRMYLEDHTDRSDESLQTLSFPS